MNNMNTSKIIACGATLLLSSCGIYTSYEPQTSVPENLYGEEVTRLSQNRIAKVKILQIET